jgi:hypothetical protein
LNQREAMAPDGHRCARWDNVIMNSSADALPSFAKAHYWTMLHPEIESEEDMLELMRGHEQIAQLLREYSEADRCEMSERTFEELASLRELN